MNSLNAAKNLARGYPGRYEAMAARLTKAENTLRHELSGAHGYKLGLEDAEEMTQFALEVRQENALAILNSFAANCGCSVLPLPSFDIGPETFQQLAASAKEYGEFFSTVVAAIADSKVTANELADVDRELGEMIAAAQALRGALARMHEAGKPVFKG